MNRVERDSTCRVKVVNRVLIFMNKCRSIQSLLIDKRNTDKSDCQYLFDIRVMIRKILHYIDNVLEVSCL